MAVHTVKGFESGYGSCYTLVTIWQADSKRELSNHIKNSNWLKEGENPGQLYAQYFKALRYYKGDDSKWFAIVEITSHYDI